ncbi:Bug family tripartite tricarboxylate transporter substrate binding protein [Pigmentiphaga humi]|uniref:Bug family tripartite tricarboxylate transporter substrate binding protein n=1 Tax=Pigmentiphaga humi TaxID=2478468 RepID=UPI0013578666|nr:tripartite tricarboxylate transporter substrate binding protein [Pigmentiphaga humi]
MFIGRKSTSGFARLWVVALAGVLPFGPAFAAPADYPSAPIKIIVPYAPGGGADTFARALGQQLSKSLGQPVVIDNRSGASGNIGAEAVARAEPDGHTLLYATSVLALSRLLAPNLRFDPQRDLAPVTMTVSIPQVLVVHPSVAAATVKELVVESKKRPGELTFSSGGHGSAGHFAFELLRQQSGIDARHIPYRGAAPALNAVLGGEVQLAFLVPPLAQQYIKSGKLRALAVSSLERSSVLPDVPSLHELGYANYEALQWQGFFVPAKTPPAIVERLHGAITDALAQPQVRALLANEGAEIVGSTPQAFAAAFKDETAKWTEVAKRTGMKFE